MNKILRFLLIINMCIVGPSFILASDPPNPDPIIPPMPRINPELDSVIEDSQEEGVRVGIEYFHPNARQMVRDLNGNLWAVFTRGDRLEANTNLEQIGIAKSDNGGASWEIPEFFQDERIHCMSGIFDSVQNTFEQTTTPSIAIDSNGTLHVVFVVIESGLRGGATGVLYHTEYSGQCWSPPERVVPNLVDRRDIFDDEVTTAAGLGGPAIAIDGRNRPHVVWTAISDEIGTLVVYYSMKEEDEWSVPILVGSGGGVLNHYYASIGIDERNTAHIAWQDNFSTIYYAQVNSFGDLGNFRTFECELHQIGVCEAPSIAVKTHQNIIIAWGASMGHEFPDSLRTSGGIWVAGTHTNWDREQVMEYLPTEIIHEVTPFFDGDGNPHLVWTDDCYDFNPFTDCARNRGIDSITNIPPRQVPGQGENPSVNNITPQVAVGRLSRIMLARKIAEEPWERSVLRSRRNWAFGTVSARYSSYNHNGGNVNIIHWDLGTPPFAANNFHIGLDVSLSPTPNRPPIADAGDNQIVYQELGDDIVDVSDLSKFSSAYGTEPGDENYRWEADFDRSDPPGINEFDTQLLRAAWKSQPGDNNWNELVDIYPAITPRITISGGASRDEDGRIINYRWIYKSNDNQVIGDGPGFHTLHNILLPSLGRHVFELIVTDDDGATSSDELRVYVNPPSEIAHRGSASSISAPTNNQVTQNISSFDSPEESDQVIICFREPLRENKKNEMMQNFKRFRSLAREENNSSQSKTNKNRRDSRKDLPVLMQLYVAEGSVQEVSKKLKDDPDVEFIVPDHTVYASERIPNDINFDELWALRNTGQNNGTDGMDIKATEAWDTTTGDSDIIVAVIDSGIDYRHPDLAPNMWRNPDLFAADKYGYDFSTCDEFNRSGGCSRPKVRDADPYDNHKHGTHVAGTIGAIANNSIGISGVAWNVKLMAVKFLGASGGGRTSDAIDAIRYAYENGAHILNNSWGGTRPNPALEAVINQAVLSHNVIFIAAAGNNGHRGNAMNYPAGYNNVITVGALDRNGARAHFSSFGEHVEVSAPGVDILSTIPGERYEYLNGTSMAAPHVAGVAALIKSAHPEWTNEKVIAELIDGDCIPARAEVGPLVNAREALIDGIRSCSDIPPRVSSGNIAEDVGTPSKIKPNGRQIVKDAQNILWSVYSKNLQDGFLTIHFSNSIDGGATWEKNPIFTREGMTCRDGTISNFPTDANFTLGTGPSIAINSMGELNVVFYGYSPVGGYQPYLTKFSGSCWSQPQQVSPEEHSSSMEWDPDWEHIYNPFPSIAIDGSDQIHIAWAAVDHRGLSNIYYGKFNGIEWEPAIKVGSDKIYDQHYPSIGVDENNDAHIAWSTGLRVRYAKVPSNGRAVNFKTFPCEIIDFGSCHKPTIAVGGSENIIVGYTAEGGMETLPEFPTPYGVWGAHYKSGNWDEKQVVKYPIFNLMGEVSSFIDAGGTPHLIWDTECYLDQRYCPIADQSDYLHRIQSNSKIGDDWGPIPKTLQSQLNYPVGMVSARYSFWNNNGGSVDLVHYDIGNPDQENPTNDLKHIRMGSTLRSRRGNQNNLRPVAVAPPDFSVINRTLVELDGSKSFDPEGEVLELYQWTNTTDNSLLYEGINPSVPVELEAGNHALILKVFDGVYWSAPDFVTVHVVGSPTLPIIHADLKSARDRANARQMVRDPHGNLWVAYTEEINSPQYQINFAISADNGQSWGYRIPIANNDGMFCLDGTRVPFSGPTVPNPNGRGAAIVMDSKGNPHIFYNGTIDGINDKRVLHSSFDGFCWTRPEPIFGDNLEFSPEDTAGPSVSIDGKDNFHVLWVAQDRIYYVRQEEGEWLSPQALAGEGSHFQTVFYPTLSVGSGNIPHAAWVEIVELPFDQRWASPLRIVYQRLDGTSPPEVVSPVSGFEYVSQNQPSIAAGRNGLVALSWAGTVADEGPFFGQFGGVFTGKKDGHGASWEIKQHEAYTLREPVYEPSVAINLSNDIYLAWGAHHCLQREGPACLDIAMTRTYLMELDGPKGQTSQSSSILPGPQHTLRYSYYQMNWGTLNWLNWDRDGNTGFEVDLTFQDSGIRMGNHPGEGGETDPLEISLCEDVIVVDEDENGEEPVTMASCSHLTETRNYSWAEFTSFIGFTRNLYFGPASSITENFTARTHELKHYYDDGDGFFTSSYLVTVLPPDTLYPVADAGPDRLVNSNTVQLDGSASYHPDSEKNILAYKWFLEPKHIEISDFPVSDPEVELENGVNRIRLEVWSEDDYFIDADEVLITVKTDGIGSLGPHAHAGNNIFEDWTGQERNFTLDGSQSISQGSPISDFHWKNEVTGEEIGTGQVVNVTLGRGVHRYLLTVTDQNGLKDESTVIISLMGDEVDDPDPDPPVTSSGCDHIIVQDLDDSGSESVQMNTCFSGDIDLYQWAEFTSFRGTTRYLGSGTSLTEDFSARSHEIRHLITPAEGPPMGKSFLITVLPQDQIYPIANVGPDRVVTSNSVDLDATASFHPDMNQEIVAYKWFLEPDHLELTHFSFQQTPTVHLENGENRIRLEVWDENNFIDSDEVTIVVNPSGTGEIGPIAEITSVEDVVLNVGEDSRMITVDGTESVGQSAPISDFQWKNEVTGEILSTSESLASLFAAGSHRILLTVTDQNGRTDEATVMVNIFAPVIDGPPVAEADDTQFIEEIVGDGWVSFGDIGRVSIALDSFPGHERWNSYADVWPSNPPVIDELDLLAISAMHGRNSQHPEWDQRMDIYPRSIPDVELDASQSSDDNGILNYEWINTTNNNGVLYSGPNEIESINISDFGNHVLKLTVKDGANQTSSDFMTVTISQHPYGTTPGAPSSVSSLISSQSDGEINFSDFLLYYAVNQVAANVTETQEVRAMTSSVNLDDYRSMGEFIRSYGKKDGENGYNPKYDMSDVQIQEIYDLSLKNDEFLAVDAGPDLEIALEEQVGGSFVAQVRLSGIVYKDKIANPKFHKLTWFVDEGPEKGRNQVSFSGRDLNALASFKFPGDYRLGLVAWDELMLRVNYVNVSVDSNGRVVNPGPGPTPGEPGGSNEITTIAGHRSVFNPEQNQMGEIGVHIPESGHADLKIYDQLGQMIGTLADETVQSGTKVFQWTGRDLIGNIVPSGAYRIIGQISGKSLKAILVVTR